MPALAPESVSAIFNLPTPDGGFEGAARLHLHQLGKKRPVVLLAFPPKAAGTYFRTAVVYAVNGQLMRVVHALGGRDGSLYLPTFVNYYSGGLTPYTMVGHVHMQGLPANIHFLESFGIRPIVMMRSIPDMLASYWDMLESEPESRKDGLNCLIPENFLEIPHETKADFLVDILGPWYVSFFASWFRYAEQRSDRACILRYRDFREKPVETLMRAVAHAGLARTREACREALDKAWEVRGECRFNKGENGRGAGYFTAEHVERLARMMAPYRSLDAHRGELLAFTPQILAQAV